MLDTTHPSVGYPIDYMSIATFAFGWITNCLHQDSYMQCFMYFGAASTPAKTADSDATAAASTGMIGTILAMIGVPAFIINLLASAGLK